MTTIGRVLWGGLVLAVSLRFIHAQEDASTSDTQVMLQALAESTPPVPASTVTSVPSPFYGFYSYQHPEWPPLPGNVFNLDLWTLGQGFYVLDDRKVDYQALQISFQLAASLDESDLARSTMLNMSVAYSPADAARPYLTNQTGTLETNQTMTMSFDILGGTNFIPYDIRSTTNLAAPISTWTWLGIGYTSNRYTFTNQPQDLAFYALMRPQDTMTVSWGNNAYAEGSIPYGLTNAVQVAGGFAHSLALLKDGSVTGWGNNLYGQTDVPTNAVGVAMVAAGWHHSVALLTNGTVLAWGLDSWLGQPIATVPPSLTNATVVSAHALHTLALREDGTVVAWGYDGGSGVTNVPADLTNVVAIATGHQHNLAAKADGTVSAWGNNNHGQSTIPAGATNVWDVAAGPWHSVALRKDGTVVCWGGNAHGECDVPSGLSNVVAVVAGGDWYNGVSYYTAALKQDGTVVSWGSGEPLCPVVGLSNVVALGSGIHHVLGIRTGPKTPVIVYQPEDQYQLAGGNVTFESRATGVYGLGYQWQHGGVDLPAETNTSLTLASVQATNEGVYRVVVSNEVGSLTSSNASFYLVTPPVFTMQSQPTNVVCIEGNYVSLSAMATAPGQANGFPLSYQWRWNGTNIAGANGTKHQFTANETNGGTYSLVASNAAGSASVSWWVTVTNAINVTNDLLLIYNTNSADSIFVKDYYLAHRPLVSGANVLGIGCTTNLIAANSDYTNNIQTPYLNWLNENPTKQPQYVVMFLGVPARVTNASGFGSVSYRLRENSPGGYRPYITHINMGDTNACRAYIDKLATLGTNISPGHPVLSASAAGYANTNLLFDNVRHGPGWGGPDSVGFEPYGYIMSNDVISLQAMNVSGMGLTYLDGMDLTNDVPPYPAHITNAVDVAGYMSWGEHSRLTGEYPMNGKVKWSGSSGWWVVETIESFNGQAGSGQGDYLDWFRADAFGGTNYSNTPVGAVSHVEEPQVFYINDGAQYFGTWIRGGWFGKAAWISAMTPYIQVVGDPLVAR